MHQLYFSYFDKYFYSSQLRIVSRQFHDRINLQGKICPIGSNALSKEMLESDKCYMLDCDNEIFVWMGRQTLLTERRTSIKAAEVSVSCFSVCSSIIYTSLKVF